MTTVLDTIKAKQNIEICIYKMLREFEETHRVSVTNVSLSTGTPMGSRSSQVSCVELRVEV